VTVRHHGIWSISLIPDGVTDSINLQSGLRQQWTGSQLIPSEVTCEPCPPKPAFLTHPQIISVVQTWEAQEPHIAPKRVSRKSISVLGHTWLPFIKTTALFFKQFKNRRKSGSRYFKPSITARFHQRTSGYLTFSNVFVDHGLCIRKTGCLVFSKTRD